MNRREFLVASGGAAALHVTTLRAAERKSSNDAADAVLRELTRTNDAHIPTLLARQERRPGHRWFGAIPNEYGIHTVAGTNGFVSALICAASAPDSRYHRDESLVEPLRHALNYLQKGQHEDGTIDYFATNFKSPPDLAFVIENACPPASLLRAFPETAWRELVPEYDVFLRRAGEALITGGVHTPNHRWVVCAALAGLNALHPDRRYVDRIDQWLAEGIDLDPDGQYTEKSTTVYSPIVDRALITVARLLDRPALLEPVRKNLEMTLYYVHPDGEVVTEASRRQDRYQRGSLARYYYAYRWLARHDGNGRFAAMARQIEQTTAPRHPGELPVYLTEPGFGQPLPPDAPLPTDYEKVFPHSGLARIRRGAASGTILAGNTTLFSFRKGQAALEAVRFATAFFGKGQFVGDALEVTQGRYVLRQELEGPYFQPLSREQIAHGEHTRMAPNGTLLPSSRALREQSNVQTLQAVVEVSERGGRFELRIRVDGTEHVPLALELAFRHGGKLHGVTPAPDVKDGWLLETGTGRYELGSDVIEFGPGRVEHTYTQVRGAVPKWDGQSVYLTGFTPLEWRVQIG